MEFLDKISAVIGTNTAWIIELVILTVGGLLLARGLKIYKVTQAALCALLGGSIGVFLQDYFGWDGLYIAAAVLAALGLFLGIRYYKFGLYILASASAWIAVFSYFWKQAMQTFQEGVEGLVGTREFLELGLENIWNAEGLSQAIAEMINGEISELTDLVETVIHTLQTGLMWAAIAGTLLGILALVLGDFIIIFVTSALGGTILLSLLELFVNLVPNMHLLVLVLLTGTGIVLQSMMKKG